MNKFELIKQLYEKDVYKDDITILSYTPNGALSNNVKIDAIHTPEGTKLIISAKD